MYEANGLPIPDLVATRDGTLLVVEIDRRIVDAIASLRTYRASGALLLRESNRALDQPDESSVLITGFCRTGTLSEPEEFFRNSSATYPEVGLWVAFTGPRTPVLRFT